MVSSLTANIPNTQVLPSRGTNITAALSNGLQQYEKNSTVYVQHKKGQAKFFCDFTSESFIRLEK